MAEHARRPFRTVRNDGLILGHGAGALGSPPGGALLLRRTLVRVVGRPPSRQPCIFTRQGFGQASHNPYHKQNVENPQTQVTDR
jgi:hypothetical protein